MNKIWKIGLVGAGRGSAYGMLTYNDPRFEITALCDLSEKTLAVYQKELGLSDSQCFTDYGQFISSGPLDAVIICTPIKYHMVHLIIIRFCSSCMLWTPGKSRFWTKYVLGT